MSALSPRGGERTRPWVSTPPTSQDSITADRNVFSAKQIGVDRGPPIRAGEQPATFPGAGTGSFGPIVLGDPGCPG